MCLAVIALGRHRRYPLVIVANRDEFHRRATESAHWWPEGWLAGRDLAAGGTWFGLTRSGRWALLTNVREPARHDPAAPSRGVLVPSVLASRDPVKVTFGRLLATDPGYNGFNLLAGEPGAALWCSNRTPGMCALGAGVHGLSNAALDTPWPKLRRTMAAVAAWADADGDPHALPGLLADRRSPPDDELPSTGVSLDWERLLSPPFIVSDDYGTRSSTVVTIDAAGRATFVERSFDARGLATGEVRESFALTAA